MNEVFKVAKFKLRLSNRKKRYLRNTMIKFTNAMAELLELIEPVATEIEFDALQLKITSRGETYRIDNQIIYFRVRDIIESSNLASYQGRYKERLTEEVTNNLSSYFNLRLGGESPSFPIKLKVGDEKSRDIRFSDFLHQLTVAGIRDDGIDEDAHAQETNLAGELVRLTRFKIHPMHFLRYRDFRIIEQISSNNKPKLLALLDVISGAGGKAFLEKYDQEKKTYEGVDLADGQQIKLASVTKIPCVLEWSLYHRLNYFQIGTPKSAFLNYNYDDDEFFLHVTFQFLPHIDEDGNLHYLKRAFDKKGTELTELNIDDGKKKKVYTCYDAITGERINIKSTNKTTENITRKTESFLGVDLGRVVLAAIAVVKEGKVLYKDFAETQKLSATLYGMYDEIGELQKHGKESRKRMRELRKKLATLTEAVIHRTANRIIWAREYYNSQLILENLSGLRRLPKKKVQQYAKLANLLTYKSQVKGFGLNRFTPPQAYYEIYPSQTSKLCSRCGFTHPKNRNIEVSQQDFKCLKCGYEINSDLNAAINIARLGEYYYNYKAVYESFDTYLIDLGDCRNANFTEYRDLQKRRGLTYYIIKQLDKRIKYQKQAGKNVLADVL